MHTARGIKLVARGYRRGRHDNPIFDRQLQIVPTLTKKLCQNVVVYPFTTAHVQDQ
jgi:hypothetical protein